MADDNAEDAHGSRLMRFNGKKHEDYKLWRMCAEIALKAKRLKIMEDVIKRRLFG